jgi:hypothetical protein
MYKILGLTEENTTCDCCGKTNLKVTVALETETGIVYFGRDCAAKAIIGNGKASSVKSIETTAKAVELAKKLLAAGHDAIKVAGAVSGRYGYPTSTKNGKLTIYTVNKISIQVN